MSRLHAALYRYDAQGPNTPPERRRLEIGAAPKHGDTVLIVEGRTPRLVVYDAARAPNGPIWAVVRAASGALIVLALLT